MPGVLCDLLSPSLSTEVGPEGPQLGATRGQQSQPAWSTEAANTGAEQHRKYQHTGASLQSVQSASPHQAKYTQHLQLEWGQSWVSLDWEKF